MRQVKKIIVHASASDHPKHDNVKTIREWHLERGFSDIGYHYILTRDGVVHAGRPERLAGAHCENHNKDSVGVCVTGDKLFTEAQMKALKALLEELIVLHNIPRTQVYPHCYFNKHKTCPNFDLNEVWPEAQRTKEKIDG